jgi:biopolymer transport protein TolR
MAGRVSNDLDEMAEINVTPLVDVMLVLLIIFIITAPMLVQGLKVNLPKQDAPGLTSKTEEPIILTLTSDQIILLGDEPIHIKLLPDRLDQIGAEQVGMVTIPEER